MSEPNLVSAMESPIGFYGKLPSVGDFVSRRLPQDFIASWDSWMQSSMAASREVLADQWLKCYLTSPIWRFALSPGLAGKDAWLGVAMPSVDRVGRYFPLIIASKVNVQQPLIHLANVASSWYEELEAVAISALEDDLSVEQFDQRVVDIDALMLDSKRFLNLERSSGLTTEQPACYLEFENPEIKLDQVYPDLTAMLLNNVMPAYSLWSSVGSEEISAGTLIVNGMPPYTAYTGMITGQFQQSGWTIQQQRIQQPPESIAQTNIEVLEPDVSQSSAIDFEAESFQANAIAATPEQRALMMHWQSFSRTDTGKVRQLNEDSILDRPDLGLWVVADGMGGHKAGDVASKKIIHSLNELQLSSSLDKKAIQVDLALQQVNQELLDLAESAYGNQVIGSTVVALVAGTTEFAYLWAGDSRVYRMRDNKLLQLSIDHCSEQEELTDILNIGSGLKQNNVITRAVGAHHQLELDCQFVEVQSGDLFLLSSDGLDKELSFQEIEQILIENSYHESVEILLEEVLNRGSRDNISVIVVHVE